MADNGSEHLSFTGHDAGSSTPTPDTEKKELTPAEKRQLYEQGKDRLRKSLEDLIKASEAGDRLYIIPNPMPENTLSEGLWLKQKTHEMRQHGQACLGFCVADALSKKHPPGHLTVTRHEEELAKFSTDLNALCNAGAAHIAHLYIQPNQDAGIGHDDKVSIRQLASHMHKAMSEFQASYSYYMDTRELAFPKHASRVHADKARPLRIAG